MLFVELYTCPGGKGCTLEWASVLLFPPAVYLDSLMLGMGRNPVLNGITSRDME